MTNESLPNEIMNAGPSAACPPEVFPKQRADAQRNREHLLISAAATFSAEGPRVSMQRIAQHAGVGIGTLYRHFPDRTALLSALSHRAYQAVWRLAQASRAAESDPFAALRHFLTGTLHHREILVLPLHGAPVTLSSADVWLRRAISAELEQMLQVGHLSGTLRGDVNATDIIVFGAMLAQSVMNFPNPELAAERVICIFLEGLRVSASPLPGQAISRATLEEVFAERHGDAE